MENVIKEFLRINAGSGSGYGYGSGDGSGYGYGDVEPVDVDLSKYKKGFLEKEIHGIDKFNGQPVYYVDNIPCVFLSIVGNVAKVNVLKDDFSFEKCYIAKANNLFAHGDTKQKAVKAVNDKFFASLSFGQKKEEFLKLFKKNENYKANVFYHWHYLLTGSCEAGRRMFVESRGIDLDSEMTVIQFL